MKGNIVFVWAWWAGLSAIVMILHKLNFQNIIAINDEENEFTQKFLKLWIKVVIWHWNYKIQQFDHVIYSQACKNSPEVQTAKWFIRPQDKQVIIMNYFQFLGEISKFFKTVWIAGTNGKSSTTAMTIFTAKNCLQNFWLWIVWAIVPQLDNNNFYLNEEYQDNIQNIFYYIFAGKKLDYSNIKKYSMILEACEYQRHFLNLDLDLLAITNIELDHTDYFKNIDDYQTAFQELSSKTKWDTITTQNLDLKIPNLHKIDIQKFNFKNIFWDFNQENATLCNQIIQKLEPENYNSNETKTNIENFKWLRRRMEYLFTTSNWAQVFSDYWHMASSIKFWYSSLKNHFKNKKIKCIFQPHQMARIVKWREEFPEAFEKYDQSIIFDIYAARENMEILQRFQNWKCKNKTELWNLFAKHTNTKYTENFQEIQQFINNCNQEDVLIYYTAWDLDFKIRQECLK